MSSGSRYYRGLSRALEKASGSNVLDWHEAGTRFNGTFLIAGAFYKNCRSCAGLHKSAFSVTGDVVLDCFSDGARSFVRRDS